MPGTNLTRDEASARAALVQVDRYDVALELELDPSVFRTSTTVHFTARTPGASTWLDFVGDAVERVVLNGRPLDPVASYADGRIELPDLAADNIAEVVAIGRYTNTGEGLHRFVDPVDGEVYTYTQFESALARQMYAVFEQPDLKASFAFTITAPEHWTVLSNEATPAPEPAAPGRATWRFAPTPRMSGYITALCAGGYVGWTDAMTGRNGTIPLGLYARRSLAEYVDRDELFGLIKTGISFFEQEYDCAYPFAKYDQIYVPEFNWGGMENAGCVTITEQYVFRGQPPAPLEERRALTILHEIAHMWFGDLVTMQWWDDLWLNESFAEWASTTAQAEATRWTEAWTTFHAHEKTWAYQQDQQPDTHPIVADMADLHIVETATDGITYAKGGSALKQLVAFVGRDAFREALRAYFRIHSWGNTTMADFLVELERASGRDLTDWSQRWLRTSAPNTLAIELATDDAGVITAATMVQTAPAEHPTLRPHRLGIGCYDLVDGRLARRHVVEVDIDGPATALPELVGVARPDLLLLNDEDLTYARIRLDDRSLATVLAHPEALDSLPRSLVLGSLWESVRDGILAPSIFADFLLRCVPVEDHPVVLRTMLTETKQTMSMLLATLRWFLPADVRAAWRERAVAVISAALDAAAPGSDKQQRLAVAYAGLAHLPADTDRVLGILDGRGVPEGLQVHQDLRWSLLAGLSSSGAVDAARLDAEVRRDPSAVGADYALLCRAALPDPAAKAAAWSAAVDQGGLSNSAMEFVGKGMRRVENLSLLEPYVQRYHDAIPVMGARYAFAIAEKFVKYFYPLDLASAQLRDTTRQWLADHPDLHSGLVRLIHDELGAVEFAVVAQECERRQQQAAR